MRLRTRVIKAGQWSIFTHVALMALRFLSNVILTRILFPEAFGTMALAGSIIAGFTLLSDFGIRAVIIRRIDDEDEKFLFSCWTFQLIRGFLLYLFIIISSLSIFNFFTNNFENNIFLNPSFYLYVAALGLNVLFTSAESANTHVLIKKLDIKLLSIIEIVSALLTITISIFLAYSWSNVWALVIAAVLARAVVAVLTHVILPGPRMRLNFNKDHFAEIIQIGKWIVVSSVATFFVTQMDKIFLGIISSTNFLGVYYIAKTMSSIVENLADRINSTLMLPALVGGRDTSDIEQRNRFYRLRLPIDLFCGILAGFFWVFSETIINLIYDDRYQEAGVILQLLSISLAIYPFQAVRARYTLIGETRIVAGNTVVEAFSIIFLMILGYATYGIVGAIWGIALYRVIPAVRMLLLAASRGWVHWLMEFRVLLFVGIGYVSSLIALTMFQWLQLIYT